MRRPAGLVALAFLVSLVVLSLSFGLRLAHALDTQAMCAQNANVAAIWADEYRDGYALSAPLAEQHLKPSPEKFEAIPVHLRAMVLAHTNKGIELVWGSTPQKEPAEVYDAFYEWCVGSGTVPQEPVPGGAGT